MEKRPNKNDLRTRETRDLLLAAAETLFIRDGYEGAELGEIAALAGRTKGAIYAQFKSKEEIFLALIELHTTRRRETMRRHLDGAIDPVANLAAMRQYALAQVDDRAWALLFLEFKLYALRHPESKAKLQRYFDEVTPPNFEEAVTKLLGQPKEPGAVSRGGALQTLLPILSGLAVEMLLRPGAIDHAALLQVTERLFDALLPAPAESDPNGSPSK